MHALSLALPAFSPPCSTLGCVQLAPHRQRRAAAPRLGDTCSTQLVVALDFDGVLCDSEPELTQTAWRTARKLWPELMEETSALEGTVVSRGADVWQLGARMSWTSGSWDELRGNGADGLPNWLRAKLRLLRPVVETGYESLLMLRLCAEEAIAAGPAKRPLTIGEIQVSSYGVGRYGWVALVPVGGNGIPPYLTRRARLACRPTGASSCASSCSRGTGSGRRRQSRHSARRATRGSSATMRDG